MTANKIIILSVTIYVIITVVSYISFSNHQFTGDAAGRGMAKGLTFFYGLGALFAIGVILTVINVFFLKEVTHNWIKLLSFAPILLPSLIIAFYFFGIGNPKPGDVLEVYKKLNIEIRATGKIDGSSLLFKSSRGSSSIKLKHVKSESDIHFYRCQTSVVEGDNRRFRIHSNDFQTKEYRFEIPFVPETMPFTPWETLDEILKEGEGNITLEFRYMISD